MATPDKHDRADHPLFWQIKYTFASPKGLLRNGAVLIEANDVITARERAIAKLSAEQQYFNITKIDAYVNHSTQRVIK